MDISRLPPRALTPAAPTTYHPREHTRNPSTRAWLAARTLEHALPGEGGAGIGRQARSAILGYLNNTRPEAIAELLQGQSVNAFV
jgi:hypothetical protein